MNNISQIQNEITQAESRLTELQEIRARLDSTVSGLRKQFILGSATLEHLQAEESKVFTLEGSILELEKQIDAFKTELSALENSERRAGLLKTLVEAARAAENAFSAHDDLVNELDGILDQKTRKLLDLVDTVVQSRQKFQQLAKGIIGESEKPVPGADVTLPADLLNDLKAAGITDEQLRIATSGGLEESDATFIDAIFTAKTLQANRIYLEKSATGGK